VVAPLGVMISIRSLEYSRLLVKVSIGCNVWVKKSIQINGQVYNLVVEVETTEAKRSYCCCVKEFDTSSESNYVVKEGINPAQVRIGVKMKLC